jgi:hypothetical protein
MFNRLAKSWLAPSRRTALGPRLAITHSNDNLPGFRGPAAGKRRSETPALTCRWLHRDGRLECCWHVETGDVPTGGLDDAHSAAAPANHAARHLATIPAVGT